MTPSELRQKLNQQKQECDALSELWRSVIDSFCPDERQFRVWLGLHDFNAVVWGIQETAAAFTRSNRHMTPEHLVRYASKTLNAQKTRIQAAQHQTAQPAPNAA